MNLLINLMLLKTEILNRLTDNNFILFVNLFKSSDFGEDPFYFFVTMNLILFLPEVIIGLTLITLIKNGGYTMIKQALNSILLIGLGVLISLVIVAPEAHAKEMDYGFFGATTEKPKTLILWADNKRYDDTFNSITITGDGILVLRTYGNGKKYGLYDQKVYQVNGDQTINFEKGIVYGFSLQLIENTGSVVRMVQATTTNPLAETANFFEYEF